MGARGPKPFTAAQRKRAFWSKVQKRGPNDCWLWTGWKNSSGYGFMSGGPGETEIGAHRFSLELHLKRKLVRRECALHNCPGGDNPACVNPAHLWVGTRKENNQDRHKKGGTRWGKPRKGESNNLAKLTESQVKKIIKALRCYKHGMLRELAEMYGVSDGTIGLIRMNRTWTHLQRE
jgi:hypothetical protein